MNVSWPMINRIVVSSSRRQTLTLPISRLYHKICESSAITRNEHGARSNSDLNLNLNASRSPCCNCSIVGFRNIRNKSNYTNHNKSKRQKPKHPQPKRKQPKAVPQAKTKKTPATLPLAIYQTTSPHVFISACALDDIADPSDDHDPSDDENDSPLSPSAIHPKDLFKTQNPPSSFRKSRFEYVSPKRFEHELPTDLNVPEVAFLGRSNVGKSSLINAITKRRQLARISKSPGRTQQVNYFALVPAHLKDDGNTYRTTDGGGDDDGGFNHSNGTNTDSNSPIGYLIDLPGYGYAKAPEEKVDAWQAATQSFLQDRVSRGNLTRLYLLVDSRRGMSLMDKMVMGWMDEACLNYTLVLTKGDCVGRAEVVKIANEVGMRYHSQSGLGRDEGNQGPFVHVVSSLKGEGIVDLMWAIDGDFSEYDVSTASGKGE